VEFSGKAEQVMCLTIIQISLITGMGASIDVSSTLAVLMLRLCCNHPSLAALVWLTAVAHLLAPDLGVRGYHLLHRSCQVHQKSQSNAAAAAMHCWHDPSSAV
jgi:hypothetical protein